MSKRRQNGVQNVTNVQQSIDSQEQGLSFDDALELFMMSRSALNLSEASQKDYRSVIRLFLSYIQEKRHYRLLGEIEEKDIIEWLSYLSGAKSAWGRPYSSRTIETYNRDVTIFFSWLVSHGHLSVNPMAGLKAPKVDKALIRLFSEDELKRLDMACDRMPKGRALTEDERKALAARDRALLWFLLSTGIRVSEACSLKFADVSWNEEMIYVQGKGAKERRIPFGKIARQHLDTYVRYWRGEPLDKVHSDDYVFLTAFGHPLSAHGAWKIFSRLKMVASIDDKRVSPHTCRHWFAVNAIKNGMPTIVLKNILGHENWDMIEIYVHLAQQDLKQSYNRFSPVDALEMHRYPEGKRARMQEWRTSRKQDKRS
ncbi:MAG: tyrosine-type recombinase/integrase [Ktedonobacteraceae bacterium]|nr:tyrosine-type recombinase/integrase [Ktedonobacteraceae bacterium]